ncbi:MAG: hypothetical protein K0R65_411 [Crocinitomicaceae bacterium]|jgi:hypothetical protein|nr:hypothetical protein [Crocinitomicaceae bacterium]
MKILLFFLGMIWTGFALSQEAARVYVSCMNRESGDPVFRAKVTYTLNSISKTVETNKKGECSFDVLSGTEITVTVSHDYFAPQTRILKVKEGEPELNLEIFLERKVRELNTVNIKAPGVPDIIYESRTYSVADFELLPQGEVLLLLYPKTLKKGSELAVLSGGEIIKKFSLPEKPLELVHDFRKNPHVICETGVFGIHRSEQELGISRLDKTYYLKYVMPIVDTSYSSLYFSTFNPVYPAFDYQAYDRLDSAYSNILEIKDDLMMELYRSEYKWVDVRTKLWAREKELETGIDKEIWIGANYFTQSVYYKELYAPMFKKNDSIYIFDYYKDKLFTFNLSGEKVDSVGIYHHYEPKKTGWRRNLIQDNETGEIYAFCEKDGICSLRRVDLKTGELGDNIVFQHRYIDKIAVSGGMAYYIYRPYESAQKKFLYRAKLPL